MLRGRRGPGFPRERWLILLDLKLPKMGGIEILKELRANPVLHPTTVVVPTTRGEERAKVKATAPTSPGAGQATRTTPAGRPADPPLP